MTIKLTAKTTDNELHDQLKQELVTMLISAGFNSLRLKGQSKETLLLFAVTERKRLVQAEEDDANAKEAKRQTILLSQQATPRINDAILALRCGFQRHLDDNKKTVTEYRQRVAACDPWAVMRNTASQIQDVMFACEMLRHLIPYFDLLDDQSTNQTLTVEQIIDILIFDLQELTNSCLHDRGYLHSSTCPITNVNNMSEFRAKQSMTMLLKSALDAFSSDLIPY
jgi:hypothetical protein